jgi:uncharacterized membrane protein
VGALIGLLLAPPGFAIGNVLGAMIGSQVGHPSEIEPEPGALTDRMRAAIPAPGSAVVLFANEEDVDAMVNTLGGAAAHVTRRALTEDEVSELNVSLRDAG